MEAGSKGITSNGGNKVGGLRRQKEQSILAFNFIRKNVPSSSAANLSTDQKEAVSLRQACFEMADKRSKSPPPPPGFRKVRTQHWESVSNARAKRPPVNGHTGVYAYHCDDCMCGMAGWPCYRDGCIWSCCGQSEKYSQCTKDKEATKKKEKK